MQITLVATVANAILYAVVCRGNRISTAAQKLNKMEEESATEIKLNFKQGFKIFLECMKPLLY